MAEQAAHNRLVEGSNPSGPINYLTCFSQAGSQAGLHSTSRTAYLRNNNRGYKDNSWNDSLQHLL